MRLGRSTSTRWPTARSIRWPTPGTWAPTFPASRACSCPMSAASTATRSKCDEVAAKGLRGIRTVMKLTRRTALALAPAIISFRAEAAEFTYKYGNQVQANHPVTMAMQKAADTGSRPSRRSAGDRHVADSSRRRHDMLSQIRTGALEFFTCSPGAVVAGECGLIDGLGFAFGFRRRLGSDGR